MKFMGMGGDGMGLQPVGMGLKLMGMGWGQGNFCGDGVGMGLMSTTVSLFIAHERSRRVHSRRG